MIPAIELKNYDLKDYFRGYAKNSESFQMSFGKLSELVKKIGKIITLTFYKFY